MAGRRRIPTIGSVDGCACATVDGIGRPRTPQGEKLPRVPLRLTNVHLPEDELEEARETARAKGISLGEYIRRAVALQLAYDRSVEAQRRETGRAEREDG